MGLWNHLSLHCHPSSSWQFSKLTNCYHDLRQSSDFSLQYVIYMSLLTQQGFFFFFSSLPYCFPQCAIQKCCEFWLGVFETALLSLALLCWYFMIDFKAKSRFSVLVCVPWKKLCLDVNVVRRYQKHSCVLETVQNITQEGTSNLWCGVTGPPTEHYWRA